VEPGQGTPSVAKGLVAGRVRRAGRCAGLAGAAVLVAGLTMTALPAARASGGVGCHPTWPVLAHRAGGQIVRLPAGAQLPVACATRTGFPTSESTIALTNSGTLVYSPAQTENSLARSVDQGATWSLTYPPGEQYTSFWNTDDPDVVADRRTGWVFWAHATGPVRTEGTLPAGSGFLLAAASGFQVYGSRDDGRTFTTADYSSAPTGDWEKVFVGPPPPSAHRAGRPAAYPDIVYLCANSPLEVVGPGRLCYKSLDGARTFVIAGFVTPSAGEPTDICPPLNFNTGVVDSRGTTYQPVTCQHGAYLAASRDEGASYEWLAVNGVPPGAIVAGQNLQVAVDDADNLYAMWSAAGLLDLTISRDHGRSWAPPLMVGAPGVRDVQLSALTAGAAGHVGITYYGSTRPSASMLSAYITEAADALDPHPLFYSGAINDPAHPIFHDYGANASPRADFIGASYDAPGTTLWAGVVDQLGAPAKGAIATSGYVGRLSVGARTPSHLP
jgi:hypothetical protein